MTYKITLLEAYMIETLRKESVTKEEIIAQMQKKDVSPWDKLDTSFDFTVLVTLFEQDEAAFQSILGEGYEVKFVTIGGVKNLIKLKFNKEDGKDYAATDKGITGLEVTDAQLGTIKQFLSPNWHITETNDRPKKINIEL